MSRPEAASVAENASGWWNDLRMVKGESMRKRRAASTCAAVSAGREPSGFSSSSSGVAARDGGPAVCGSGVRARTGSSRGAASAFCTARSHITALPGGLSRF